MFGIPDARRGLRSLALVTLVVFGQPAFAHADESLAYQPDPAAARADVPDQYKWDLTPLFASPEAWEESYTTLAAQLPTLAAFRGRLAEPQALHDCLVLYFDLHDRANHLTLYAALLADAEQLNESYQVMSRRGMDLMDRLMGEAAFIRAEVLALSDKELDKGARKVPELAAYRRYLDEVRRRRHTVLSEDAERVLSLMGDNLWAEIDLNEIPSTAESAYVAMLTDMTWPTIRDGEGNEVPLGMSGYVRYRRDPSRVVRREAVAAFMGTLRQYEHVFAATLGGQAEFDVALARSRGYDTAREAYLDKDGLEPVVYDNLIETVRANTEPLHRYVALRARLLGIDQVHLYDMYVPMVEDAGATVPFDRARATIVEALAPMGEEYVAAFAEGMDPANGWLDLYPAEDKASGAFCASVYGSHPYVKMNYQDSVNDMSTLAHEYGHAMHSTLSMEAQGYPDFRYVPFLAEIASTAHEALVIDHLLANATDDRVRASLLSDRLESIRGTIYRQAMFGEFELALHRHVEAGTPITAGLLEETYVELLRAYYGDAYAIDADDGMEWAYIPHFYWKYYVWVYATGLSSGIAIADNVRKGPAERDAFVGMLSAGSDRPPLEILRGAGVDLSRPDAIEAALGVFRDSLDELETLLPKLEAAAAAEAAPEGSAVE